MTDWDTHRALEQVFAEVNRSVGDFEAETNHNAAEVARYFTEDGGNISALGNDEFAIQHTAVDELFEWDDPWDATYGLDGSSTTAMTFQNGLVTSASAAKMGVAGQDGNTDIVNETTISAVVYLQNEDFEVDDVDVDIDGVDANLHQFPQPTEGGPYSMSKMENWLVTLANGYAEGKHARNLADDLNGPLFIDGALYPSNVFSWMLFAQGGDKTRTVQEWPEAVNDILSYYVETIETMHDRDLPVMAVTKTTVSDQCLQALSEKVPEDEVALPLPWNSDHQFFSAALADDDGRPEDEAVISYTPWLLQNRYGSGRNAVVPFETYDGVDLKYGVADDYQKAFFYARTPVTHRVMRVEAPLCAVRRQDDRENVQRKALVELAEQRKEPRCITQADDRARISRDNRNNLREVITRGTETDAIIDYNERRNFDQFDREQ